MKKLIIIAIIIVGIVALNPLAKTYYFRKICLNVGGEYHGTFLKAYHCDFYGTEINPIFRITINNEEPETKDCGPLGICTFRDSTDPCNEVWPTYCLHWTDEEIDEASKRWGVDKCDRKLLSFQDCEKDDY